MITVSHQGGTPRYSETEGCSGRRGEVVGAPAQGRVAFWDENASAVEGACIPVLVGTESGCDERLRVGSVLFLLLLVGS